MSTACFFKVNFPKKLFYLWVLLCSKVGDIGDFVSLSGTAIDRVLNPVQIGSVLTKILCLKAGSGKLLRQ